MKKIKNIARLWIAVCLLLAFVLWTVALCFVDVKAIGPNESSVGFATLNGFFHNLTGVHFSLYVITDWLGLVPIGFAMGFGLLGLVQWIQRGKLFKVDYDLFVLGGFYIVVFVAYLFFEGNAVNFRPVLIDGYLETSYPSSTTLLVLCVMPTAIMQLQSRIRNRAVFRVVRAVMLAFILFMVLGRLLAGVHWLTDIVGGVLLSLVLVEAYRFFVNIKTRT